MHFTPDGRFGFIPERDQDTVAKVDLATRKVVNRVSFPAGSKPYMLRVAPGGRELWVATQAADTNSVLDVDTMAVLSSTPTGRQPTISAFQPDGGRYVLLIHQDDTFVSVRDRATQREVQRIEIGLPQINAAFTPDGATAFVAVPKANALVVLDMNALAIVGRIPTGAAPGGLVLLDPVAGPPTGAMPGLPNTGAGGGAGARDDGAWLLGLGGLGLLGALGLRLRRRIPPAD
ncbi:MAG TPA: hypothetical protein VFL91_01775 [Thermomicrobiales bacterium]|nr:hypothetical protein [Thermomicrobiales bacterium]